MVCLVGMTNHFSTKWSLPHARYGIALRLKVEHRFYQTETSKSKTTNTLLRPMKLRNLLLAAAAVIGLAACNENTNEYHSTYFYPITASGVQTFADQQLDSVRVMSYDTWTLNNTVDWVDMKVGTTQTNQIKVEVPVGYFNLTRLDFVLKPNTTGKTRTTPVQVTSSFGKVGTIATVLIQYPFHNITTPAAKMTENGTNATFTLDLPQKSNKETATSFLSFTVYTSDAQLTSSADWLTVDKANGYTPSVKEKVNITAQPNTTGEARKAQLTLTSGGVSTVINVNQPKAK